LRDGQFDHILENTSKATSASKAADAKAADAKAADAKASDEAAPSSIAHPRESAPHIEAAVEAASATDVAATDVSATEVATNEDAAALATDGPFRSLPSAIPPPTHEKLNIAAPAPSSQRFPTPGLGMPVPDPPDAPDAPPDGPRLPQLSHAEAAPASVSPASAPRHLARLTSPPVGTVGQRPAIPRDDPEEEAAAAAGARDQAARERGKSPSVRDLTLDFDALETPADRAAAREPRPAETGALFRANDLPPPPANLFAKKSQSGAYRAAEHARRSDPREEPASMPPASMPPASMPPASNAAPSTRSAKAPETRTESPKVEQRYAPARPATVFGASGTRPQPASIFSDALVSDKSLDEVILSYLAEDLEPPNRK
jgi:hypothetical protein